MIKKIITFSLILLTALFFTSKVNAQTVNIPSAQELIDKIFRDLNMHSSPVLPASPVTPTPTKIYTRVASTPFPTRTIAPSPTPTAGQTATLSIKEFMMGQINEYRQSKGLSKVATDPYTCAFAVIRAKEISTGFNHNGFTNRVNSKTLPYPNHASITENIAMNSNYKNVVQAWINSAGHRANIEKNTSYVCVEKYGNYFAYEGWRSR